MRPPKILAVVVTTSAAAAAVLYLLGAFAHGETGSAVASTCRPLPVLSSHLSVTGGTATQDTVYRLGTSTISVAAPPSGFSPATSSPRERRALGITALPVALRRAVLAPGMRYDSSGSLCERPAVQHTVSSTSQNWAGVAVVDPASHTSFWQAVANWTVPQFTTTCLAPSDHAMWTGVGGYHTDKLMQAGIDTFGNSDPNAVYPWFEVLYTPDPTNPYDPANLVDGGTVLPGLKVHAGDSVTVDTEYLSARNEVIFWFMDWSTHQDKEVPLTGSIDGHKLSFFYDGQSAEVINEEDQRSFYRQPKGSITRVSQVDFNSGQSVAALSKYARVLTMTTGKNGTGQVVDAPSDISTYRVAGQQLMASRWSDNWKGCGAGAPVSSTQTTGAHPIPTQTTPTTSTQPSSTTPSRTVLPNPLGPCHVGSDAINASAQVQDEPGGSVKWVDVVIHGSSGAGARIDMITPTGTEVTHWSGVKTPTTQNLGISEPIHSKLYITGIFPNTTAHCSLTLQS
jgi:hypothetical protein